MRPLHANSPDLSIIIVSTNEAHWLSNCLSTVYAHAGDASLDVIVVDNSCTDGTAELVAREFPAARVVHSRNLGFAHGNNRGLETSEARHVLFLNPDTEIVDGTFGDLVQILERRPEIGLVGVRQLTPEGEVYPTIRRFPSVTRALGEALGSERWAGSRAWAGERVLDPTAYEQESECDWTSGSFMFARREALQSAGFLDERFFLYAEEPDLCLRIRRHGWTVMHLPRMTIVHHAGKAGIRPRMIAQDAFTRRQYAAKHFGATYSCAYLGAVAARHAVRALAPGADVETVRNRRAAARLALRTLAGRIEPPFGAPPPTAVAARVRTPASRELAVGRRGSTPGAPVLNSSQRSLDEAAGRSPSPERESAIAQPESN
jgi:GT2 family glycosyltransferase